MTSSTDALGSVVRVGGDVDSTNAPKRYKFAVIGNGLIGSAAGRYLSEWHAGERDNEDSSERGSVVIVGAPEPTPSPSSGGEGEEVHGVFGSHYDQGRIYSLCGTESRDPVWGAVNRRAVERYADIEERSGIAFHEAVGAVEVGRASDELRQEIFDWLKSEGERREQRGDIPLRCRYFPAGDRSWREIPSLSVFDFSSECDLLYEAPDSTAGIVNPRQLIAAQNAIARQHGCTVVSQVVVGVVSSSEHVELTLSDGSIIRAERALVACGAFTNYNNLLPHSGIPLRCKTETTVWGTVSKETAAEQLRDMPAACYDIPDNADVDDLYMAPPLPYPDGTHKIKMGGNTKHERWPTSLEEIREWFVRGDSDADLDALRDALRNQLPEVEFSDVTTHRCIVAYTPSGYPVIDEAPSPRIDGDEEGRRRLFVAAGGNGVAAAGSDTLGYLAAGLVFDGRWRLDDVPRQCFLAEAPRATNALSVAWQRAAGGFSK